MGARATAVTGHGVGTEARVVAGAFLAYGAIFFDRLAPLYLVGVIAADLGVPSAAEGTLALLIGVGWAAAMPIARLASGRWSHRRRVVVAGLGSAAIGGLSVIAPGWGTFVALRGLAGLVAATAAPAVTGLTFAAAPARRRGLDLGLVQSSTRLLGSLLSPALVTAVAVTAGWRPALLLSAALVVLGAIVLLVLVPAEVAPGQPGTSGSLSYRAGGRRNVVVCVIAAAVLLLWLTLISQIGVGLLTGWLDVSTDRAGQLVGAFGLGAAIGALAVPPLSDRMGRRAALAASATAGGLGGLLLGAAALTDAGLAPLAVALLLALGGMAMGGFPLVISIIPAEAVATGDVGRALAAPIVGAELVGGAALPALAGAIAAQLGGPVVLLAAAGAVLLVGVLPLALAPLERSEVIETDPATAP